jgi:hypothetical protein
MKVSVQMSQFSSTKPPSSAEFGQHVVFQPVQSRAAILSPSAGVIPSGDDQMSHKSPGGISQNGQFVVSIVPRKGVAGGRRTASHSAQPELLVPVTKQRRSPRIPKPIRVRITGNDPSGFAFSEDTVTVCINRQGACISAVHALVPNDTVRIKNLQNGIEEDFRVVGVVQPALGGRPDWGVELLNPQAEIWGSPLPPTRQRLSWIRCGVCGKVELEQISSIEHMVLQSAGMIPRQCQRCNRVTRWKPCDCPPLSEAESVFEGNLRGLASTG